MSGERRARTPLVLLGATAAVGLATTIVGWRDQGLAPLIPIAFSAIGALIARRTRNPIGWLFQAVALAGLGEVVSEAYLFRSSIAAHPLPGVAATALVNQCMNPLMAAIVVAILLIYPTGRPPSKRWEPLLWALAAFTAAVELGSTIQSGPMSANHAAGLANPLGIDGLSGAATSLARIGNWGLVAAGAGSLAALIVRYRRSGGDEREQVRWLAYVGLVGAASLLLATVGVVWSSLQLANLIGNVGWIGFTLSLAVGIPAAMTLAILKYHLYDIDIIIGRTLVYAALAAFITAVYVLVVVGVGAIIGSRGKPNLALSILATALVAVAFQPVRERVQRFANRLVYGKRATPYEALSELSDRMAGTYATEDVLPRMARNLAEATGAARTDVWLRAGDELRSDASWPVGSEARQAIRLAGDDIPTVDGIDRIVPVRHQGELLGALSIAKRRGEAFTPTEETLVADLAAQAGLVLRNVGLTEQLVARLEELRTSRQRLVTAQDEERRRLERNIHDGAQQQLVALTVSLRLAKQMLDHDEDEAKGLLRQVRSETTDALENLRDLARGIYPPLLADQGLAAALEAQTRKSPVTVAIDADGIGRLPQDIEAAVYFCCLEALQNIAKYAGASQATIRLTVANGDLQFEIVDDGCGFDPAARYGSGLQGMADRLDAIGGELMLESFPGRGTTVRGRIPWPPSQHPEVLRPGAPQAASSMRAALDRRPSVEHL